MENWKDYGFNSQREYEGYCKCFCRIQIGDKVELFVSGIGHCGCRPWRPNDKTVEATVIGIDRTPSKPYTKIVIGSPKQTAICLWAANHSSFTIDRYELIDNWYLRFPYVRYISSLYDGRLKSVKRQ